MTITNTTDTPNWQLAGNAWSHAAPDWAYRFEPYADNAIDTLFDQLNVGVDTKLIDIACGSGYALGQAVLRGARCSGLDASAGLIDIAHRRAPAADLRTGDMFALPWADRSFDVATSFNGVWGGCTEALVEAARVLNENGRIGLTFWGPGHALDLRDWFLAVGTSTPSVGEEMISLADIGSPGVVEDMLDKAGFGSIERFGVPAVLEFADDEDAWRTLRSPGLVVPALDHVGEDELRHLTLDAISAFKASDGSYRLVNELTCVTASKS